jgi:hypothetical protein
MAAAVCPVAVPLVSLLLHLFGLLFYDFETWSFPAALIPNILYNISFLGRGSYRFLVFVYKLSFSYLTLFYISKAANIFTMRLVSR